MVHPDLSFHSLQRRLTRTHTGIRSSVRSSILGKDDVQPIPESLGLLCQVDRDRVRANPLTAELVSGNAMTSWWGPNRHIISGIRNNGADYSISLFVHDAAAQSERASAEISVPNQGGQKPGDVGAVRKFAEIFEPRARIVFDMVNQEDCLLWHVAFLSDLPTWVSSSGKVTLLGDAAHAMTPHLGQVRLQDSHLSIISKTLKRVLLPLSKTEHVSQNASAVLVIHRIFQLRCERMKSCVNRDQRRLRKRPKQVATTKSLKKDLLSEGGTKGLPRGWIKTLQNMKLIGATSM